MRQYKGLVAGLAIVLVVVAGFFAYNYLDSRPVVNHVELEDQYTVYDFSYFAEGKIPVEKKVDGAKKFGYLDKNAKEVIEFKFDATLPFDEGRAAVWLDEKWGYINHDGEVIVPIEYDFFGVNFGEGLALKKDNEYYHVDPVNDKTVKFETNYEYVDEMYEGLSLVNLDGKWGFINVDQEVVIPLKYDLAGNFNDGVAPVSIGESWGYIDLEGNEVVSVEYDAVTTFSEGLGVVIKDNKYGAIDKEGNIVIPLEYEHLGFFKDGITTARKDGKAGLIDNKGEVVIEFDKYDDVDYFFEDIAIVGKDNKYGYINREGEEIIPLMYTFVEPFLDGLAIAEIEGKARVINAKNEIVAEGGISNRFRSFSDGVALEVGGYNLRGLVANNKKKSDTSLFEMIDKYRLYQ